MFRGEPFEWKFYQAKNCQQQALQNEFELLLTVFLSRSSLSPGE
jgi:hypothetical protein